MEAATANLFDMFLTLATTPLTAERVARNEAEAATEAAKIAGREAEAARIIAEREAAKCGRCNGTGYLSIYAYNGGTCYGCGGRGTR